MTTIVRSGDMVYSDSCYGAPIGTERSRVFGEPKFFINTNKTFLAGICGSIPSDETCRFLTGQFLTTLERYLGNFMDMTTMAITSHIENFYESLKAAKPTVVEHYTMVFFTKDITLQLNVRVNKERNIVRTITYGKIKDLAFGSGAAWWIAQKDLKDLTIEQKFEFIYRLDINSGGEINAFDLNQLKEIKL